VAAGDHSQRAPETGPREIVAVAREFNRMVQVNSAARAQLRASEAQYRLLIENLPVAVVTHWPDGAMELCNPLASALLRLSPAQMKRCADSHLDNAVAGAAAPDLAWQFVDDQGRTLAVADLPVSRLLRTRQPLPPAIYGIASAAPGQAVEPHTWVMVTGYPQFDRAGDLQRVIVAFVDVSDQQQAEALRLAKESAEAASKAKSLFLSRVSHELRTPLNAINGFSELVLMDPNLPVANRDRLNHVLTAGRHLLVLINQVLDLSQAETAGELAPVQPVTLWPLLADCVALCSPLAQARGVQLDLPALPADGRSPRVLADPARLRQVLVNLLSNAIKFNRPQGLVSLRCEAVAAVDGAPAVLRLHVRDSGPGLSAAQQAALFQPFNRLGAEYSGIEGHGLGLSIARMLAQAMGGDIRCDSAPGEGATFTLQLRLVV
jgi:signal transduction histidine kinase